MTTSIDDDPPCFVHEATVPCATWRWVEWLLAQPEWRTRILELSAVGAKDHRQGLAYREGPVGDVIPDKARFARWRGGQRALGLLLPKSLRELVGWLVLQPSLEVRTAPSPPRLPRDVAVVQSGPPIARARMERAQSVALSRLRGQDASSQSRRRDAEAFRRFLVTIDPGQDPLLFVEGQTPEKNWLKVGDVVNTSATAAARHRQFLPRASAAGFPALGSVATQAFGLAGLRPPDLPLPLEERFDIHPTGLG